MHTLRRLCPALLVLAAATAAAAQPAVTATLDAPAPAGLALEAGPSRGVFGGLELTGGVLDLSRRLRGTTSWAHVAIAGGTAAPTPDAPSGAYLEIRTGVEARPCTRGGAVCLLAGVDLGVDHGRWHGRGTDAGSPAPFAAGATGGATAPIQFDTPLLAPRVGVDVGTATLRVRGVAELPVALSDKGAGASVSARVAILW